MVILDGSDIVVSLNPVISKDTELKKFEHEEMNESAHQLIYNPIRK